MYNNELMHFGVKGQKWGVIRYQKKDGTLTPAGRKRYNAKDYDSMEESKKIQYHKDQFKQKRNDYAEKASNGEKFAKGFLFGAPGSYAYDTLRLMGDSKIAAGAKVAGASLLPVIGPIVLDQITIANYAKNKVKTTS